MGDIDVDFDLISQITHQMELREPNAEAVRSVALAVSNHFDKRESDDTFEGVVSSATGVGKTFVMGGLIDYLSQARGWSNFAIIVPGRTILEKTVANFTHGSSKDLASKLGVKTALVTVDNFDSPEIARQMDNPDVVKVFVFTVQALLRPNEALRRRTRTFSEGLGAELYQWLADADDLVVLADEHHLYYGEQFSDTLRGLRPRAIIGLTATPHRDTPPEQIVFRYPLAAAIAQKWVKTPVIVGRKDDRSDLITRLNDGVTLLECKRAALSAYRDAGSEANANPFMLVVASNTTEANEIVDILRADTFRGGDYRDAVLQVDSTVTEDREPGMWSRLAAVDSVESEVRIVVSVRMLKEGWDVRGVYVLLSTQPSISTMLTEQVLGRGLRLPFGSYTGVEMLDTLEVVAHEKFAQLLAKAGVLNESVISYRTQTILTADQNGKPAVIATQSPAGDGLIKVDAGEPDVDSGGLETWDGYGLESPGAIAISTIDTRAGAAESESGELARPPVSLRENLLPIHLPKLRQVPVARRRSLSEVTDEDQLEALGRRLRAQPEDELRRIQITATHVEGPDGVFRSEIRQVTASDLVTSAATLNVDFDWSRGELVRHVMQLPMVDASADARAVERSNAERLVDAFVRGLGDDAQTLLAAYAGRSAVRLGQHIQQEMRKGSAGIAYTDSYSDFIFKPSRLLGTRSESDDRRGRFATNIAYVGWSRSAFSHAWFDSAPERTVALILDEEEEVGWWARLLNGDLSIVWGAGQNYNPDLLAAIGSERWLIEVKADNKMSDEEVQAKRVSAKAWVNYVNGLTEVQERAEKWRYLLVSESDIEQAKGSWGALAAFGF
jgi:type III restriction enzyme